MRNTLKRAREINRHLLVNVTNYWCREISGFSLNTVERMIPTPDLPEWESCDSVNHNAIPTLISATAHTTDSACEYIHELKDHAIRMIRGNDDDSDFIDDLIKRIEIAESEGINKIRDAFKRVSAKYD